MARGRSSRAYFLILVASLPIAMAEPQGLSSPPYTIRRIFELSGEGNILCHTHAGTETNFRYEEEQTKSLTKTLGDAFKDGQSESSSRRKRRVCSLGLLEPFTNVVTNGDVEFFGDFHRSTVVAGLLGGEVYVAENASQDIVGVAVWFGPGREMFDRSVNLPFLVPK